MDLSLFIPLSFLHQYGVHVLVIFLTDVLNAHGSSNVNYLEY